MVTNIWYTTYFSWMVMKIVPYLMNIGMKSSIYLPNIHEQRHQTCLYLPFAISVRELVDRVKQPIQHQHQISNTTATRANHEDNRVFHQQRYATSRNLPLNSVITVHLFLQMTKQLYQLGNLNMPYQWVYERTINHLGQLIKKLSLELLTMTWLENSRCCCLGQLVCCHTWDCRFLSMLLHQNINHSRRSVQVFTSKSKHKVIEFDGWYTPTNLGFIRGGGGGGGV